MTIQKLKQSLASCHIHESSPTYQALKDVGNVEYFLLRASEQLVKLKANYNQLLKLIDGQEGAKIQLIEDATVAIQLINMFKVKING